MKDYYVNPNPQPITADNEVHEQGCYWLSLVKNPVYLGKHLACFSAVAVARQRGYKANGCKFCSPSCHTT